MKTLNLFLIWLRFCNIFNFYFLYHVGGIVIDISIIISIIAVICSILSIILSIYLNKRSLNVPAQRESLMSFINLLDNEIKKHEKIEKREGNTATIEYIIYYSQDKPQNYTIQKFIELLNDFKETTDYLLLDKKYKKQINKIIGEWSNYSSEDVNSPDIYISKLKDIKRTFVCFIK